MKTWTPAAWMAMAVCALPVSAQTADEYVVVEGDDCEVVAKKVYGDKKLLPLLHEANPDLGPVPHKLKPGQRLRTPKPGAEAKVTFIRKDVEAATPAAHPAKVNEDLDRGHKVSTLASSSAEITFKDTTRLQLAEHTLVVILGGSSTQSSSKQATASDTTLLTGELHAHLGALVGKPKPVLTPGARVEVGGESRVSVDGKKTTRLAVYQGQSTLASSGAKVAVKKGFGSKADLGKKPTAPKPLPVGPTWVKAAPPTVVTLGDGELLATHGPAAPGVEKFHVQIARDAAFNDLVVDARVPSSIVSLEAKALPPGGYYTRVSAIDGDAFEGAYGDVSVTQVLKVTAVPASAGKPAALVVPPGAFCGLDGAELTAAPSLELAPGRAHTLRCATTASGEGAAELPLDAAIAGEAPTPAPPPTPPPATAPPPAAPPAPVWQPLERELGVSLGTQQARLRLGWGGALGLEGTLGFPLGAATLSLGLGADWERYGVSKVGGELHGFHLGDAFALDAPIALRFGTRRLQIYARVVPQFLFDRVRYNVGRSQRLSRDETSSVAVPACKLGAGVRLTMGKASSLHLEGGYRLAPDHAHPTGDVSLAGAYGLLSSRFEF